MPHSYPKGLDYFISDVHEFNRRGLVYNFHCPFALTELLKQRCPHDDRKTVDIERHNYTNNALPCSRIALRRC